MGIVLHLAQRYDSPDLGEALRRKLKETARRVQTFRAVGLATKRSRVPRQRFPTLIESDFATSLIAVVKRAHVELEPLRAELPRLLYLAGKDHERVDRAARLDAGEAARAQALIAAARERMAASTQRVVMLPMLAKVASRTAAFQHDQLDKQVRAALGVPLWTPKTVPIRLDSIRADSVDSTLEAFVTHNVSVIKSLGDQPLDEIEKLVTRAFVTGARHETLMEQIQQRYDVAESSARLIARSQLAALNGQVTRERHKQLGIHRWVWRTVGDKDVRPEHAELEGKEYNYDGSGRQPPFMPGQVPNCRCGQEPVFTDVLDELDALEAGDDEDDGEGEE